MSAYFIKVRAPGEKRYAFLARNGTNNLRVHACLFATLERAEAVIAENRDDNPGWDWKAVPA